MFLEVVFTANCNPECIVPPRHLHLFDILKLSLPPSSDKLSWDTVKGLLGLAVFQSAWKPPPKRRQPVTAPRNIPSFAHLRTQWKYLDEMYDKAGKLPILTTLLGDALELYPNKRKKTFSIIPQARLIPNNDFKTDYAMAVVEVSFWCALVSQLTSVLLHLSENKYKGHRPF